MARDPVKQKIVRVLREAFSSPQDRIVLLDGSGDFLHLYLVSSRFKGMEERKKGDMVWEVLFGSLNKEEWGRVSMVEPLTPREAKEYWPPIPELNGR